MKKRLKLQLKYCFFIPTILVGIFLLSFFVMGFKIERKEKYIYGVNVTSLSKNDKIAKVNEKILTELKQKSLIIESKKYNKKYVFSYPEINYVSNLTEVVNKKEKSLVIKYLLLGIDDKIYSICGEIEKPCINATVKFCPNEKDKFLFLDESDGIICDRRKLKEDILFSLNNNFERVEIVSKIVKPQVTKIDEQKSIKYLSNFSTWFSEEHFERADNIRLAVSLINGTVVKSGEEFSFNSVVGARTESRGFKKAKIIVGGEYVEGFGGGVCQVSTTLYNAVLLAGLKVTEQHPHSLAVSYVEPSFDAMVSGRFSDFKFVNSTEDDIYIQGKVVDGDLSFILYGKPNDFTIERKSVITQKIPTQEEVIYGDEDKILQKAKEGVISKGYLLYKRDGLLVKCEEIRKDYYQATKGIVQKKQKSIA